MGHGHLGSMTIPKHTIYNNYREFPEPLVHGKRVVQIGRWRTVETARGTIPRRRRTRRHREQYSGTRISVRRSRRLSSDASPRTELARRDDPQHGERCHVEGGCTDTVSTESEHARLPPRHRNRRLEPVSCRSSDPLQLSTTICTSSNREIGLPDP